MRIQHNVAALNAYRNYSKNTSAISKNLEKLSSGYKINRAGDDAAGLAVSEKMRLQISGLAQAQNNAKSAISYVQTAEGALQEVHDMLNRMYTLAEQSANGTFADDTDRVQIQKEVNSLMEEIDRIGKTANFNGLGIFAEYTGGAGAAAAGAVEPLTATADGTNAASLGTVKLEFAADATDEQKAALNEALKDQTVKFTTTVNTAGTWANGDSIAVDKDFSSFGYTAKYVDQTNNEVALTTTAISVHASNANTLSKDQDLVINLYDDANKKVATLTVGKPTGQAGDTTVTFADASAAPAATGPSLEPDTAKMTAADLKSIDLSSLTDLKGGEEVKVAFDAATAKLTVTVDGTAFDKTIAAGDTAGSEIELTSADGKKIKATLADALNSIADTGGTDIAEDTVGKVKAAKSAGGVAGTVSFWIGAEYNEDNQLKISGMHLCTTNMSVEEPEYKSETASTVAGTQGDLTGVQVDTAENAMASLQKIKTASDAVSNMRGTLGAMQNRLDHTINNLSVMEENMTDAESVIRDTDVAKEMMDYTKNNILVQSAQAMLAQANQIPQGVLQLLG